MLHNYLLPRNCPRVTYYAKDESSESDINKFIGNSCHKYTIAIEETWLERVKETSLFLYELPAESFKLLDEGAGYCVSRETIRPLNVKHVKNILQELNLRDVELCILPSLHELADQISKSSLQFSIIRMKNASQ